MTSFLNPIRLLVGHCMRHWSRNLVWWLRLARVDAGKGLAIHLPSRISGNGRLKFGSNCRVDKGASFNCSDGSLIEFDNDCWIGENLYLSILPGKHAHFKAGASIQNGCLLSVAGKWEIGTCSSLETNCSIASREQGYDGSFVVGDHSYVGENTLIDTSGGVLIGNHVAIGPNCVIYSHDHEPDMNREGVWKGGVKTGLVSIGDGAWIGAGVIILSGVSIGEKAIIGAGAVVTRNIPPGSLAVGVPAKVLNR